MYKLKITGYQESLLVTTKIFQKIRTQGIPPKRFFRKAIKYVIFTRGILRARRTGRRRRKRHAIFRTLHRIARVSRQVSRYINRTRRELG